MADGIAIKVDNVSKTFKLPHEKAGSIKSAVVNWRKRQKGYETQHVLKGISFEVKKGDFLGIVGRNGSGKSTLLKIMSQIYAPDGGSVRVNGRLTPFIELGVGFNPELTGRENVFLNGALLGFSRREIEAMYDEVVEFAELSRFMDQKLKNYSSGMQVRLAFSIAIRADTDILVLDEVLAVGDEAFQRKCNRYFEDAKKKGKTIVLVTHNMEAVRQYCNRAIFIRKGRVVLDGSPEEVADEYSLENIRGDGKITAPSDGKSAAADISVKSLRSPVLKSTDKLELEIEYRNSDNREVYPKLIFYYQNTPVLAANGKVRYGLKTADNKRHKFIYTTSLNNINHGEIKVVAVLVDSKNEVNLASYGHNNEVSIIIKDTLFKSKIGGIFKDIGEMRIDK